MAPRAGEPAKREIALDAGTPNTTHFRLHLGQFAKLISQIHRQIFYFPDNIVCWPRIDNCGPKLTTMAAMGR
jgi:hypothetical protein